MTGEADPTERQVHLATLRADRDIQAWFKDHRSTHTAEVQLQQLELFLRLNRDVAGGACRARSGAAEVPGGKGPGPLAARTEVGRQRAEGGAP